MARHHWSQEGAILMAQEAHSRLREPGQRPADVSASPAW